jgi:hypothetical protein
LCKAFILEEELPLTAAVEIPTVVSGAVNNVEEREELGEMGVNGLPAGVPGTGIKHVDNIKGKKEAGVVLRTGDVAGDEEVEEIGNGVNTAIDGDTKLASGEKVGGERGAEVGHDYGASDAAAAGADADRAEFHGVGFVFLEREEVVCSEGRGGGGGMSPVMRRERKSVNTGR